MKTAQELREMFNKVEEATAHAEDTVETLEEGIYQGLESVELSLDHFADPLTVMDVLRRAGYHVFETVELGEDVMVVSFKENS